MTEFLLRLWRANNAAITAFNRSVASGWPFYAPPFYTLSAYAWRLETQQKFWGRFWRHRIDGLWLFLFSKERHCEGAWARDHALFLNAEGEEA